VFLLLFANLLSQTQRQYLFSHLGSKSGLSSDEVMAVQQDQKGYLWIATLNGIQRYDGHRFVTFLHNDEMPESIPNDEIRALKLDRQNRLWMLCKENQVGWYSPTEYKFTHAKIRWINDKPGIHEGTMFSDSDNHIFLNVPSNGLYMYHEAQAAFTPQLPFFIPHNWQVNSFFHPSTGTLGEGCGESRAPLFSLSKSIPAVSSAQPFHAPRLTRGAQGENGRLIGRVGRTDQPCRAYLNDARMEKVKRRSAMNQLRGRVSRSSLITYDVRVIELVRLTPWNPILIAGVTA
jgi:hypothetical protein